MKNEECRMNEPVSQRNLVAAETIEHIRSTLTHEGWVRLTGYDSSIESFSALIGKLCTRVTFDPARSHASKGTQKVDAGTDAVGLHIENGNTPLPPAIVAFYCEQAARSGAQTTVCDGAKLFEAMPNRLKELFSKPVTVRRHLPRAIWQQYVATAVGYGDITLVTEEELNFFMSQLPGQSGELAPDGTLDYALTIDPIMQSSFAGRNAFANAILGPSFNYEAPSYELYDGTILSDTLRAELADLAEQVTEEIQWVDGEIVVIDNHRVMHGRRAIPGNPGKRKLFIGMGQAAEDIEACA